MSTNENLKQLSIAEQRATKLVADAREGTYNEKKKKKSRRRRFLIPDIFFVQNVRNVFERQRRKHRRNWSSTDPKRHQSSKV